MNSKQRFILDLGPLLVFFAVHHFAGLIPATTALIVGTAISLAIYYVKEKRIAPMPLFSGIAVGVFGGLTILLNDELFIKIKPTIINLLFATILLGGLYYKKPLLKYVLGEAMTLQERGWAVLSRNWGMFFIFLAALNEFIWRNFSTDFWVSFKVFGMLTMTMVFTIAQVPVIKKYWIEEDPSKPTS